MIKVNHILFIFFCGCILSACGQKTMQAPSPETVNTEYPTIKNTKPEEIALLYQTIYEETSAAAPSAHDDTKNFETVQAILQRLEPYGITAIDIENQADMVNAQPMRDFITVLQNGGTAEHTVLVVSVYGRFFEYDLSAKEGSLEVAKTYYQYTDGIFESKSTVTYPTDSWLYTDEGYFIFTGNSSSPESYVLTMSDEPEISAWRIEPLDAQCRAMNRAYLLPIGYQKNNMFLVDWKETDYGCLDFYDLFDKLYPSVYGHSVPYVANENITIGAVYQIPEKEFETVISEHFSIDYATLRTKTKYLKDAHAYEYHPRGFYEVEYANLPYPEVVSYTENSDRTITLLVNAVYPSEGTSKAFTHQVTVRPLGQDSFQYVSNKTLPSKTDHDVGWHTDRLTDSEWETHYGKQSLFTEEEKEELEQEALATVSPWNQTDFFSMADSINMKNYDRIEAFYEDYVKKQDSQVTVYHAYNDGSVGAFTFLYRNGHLQTYYVEIRKENSSTPKITSVSENELSEITLTPKGYLIYSYQEPALYAELYPCWRIRPLSEPCQELTKKYIYGLSYVNYNLLTTDWDETTVETILLPHMYEDICRIHTGKEPEAHDGRISSEQYEEIMMRYLPVTREQLRKYCGYDAEDDSYPHDMIFPRQYPPFGEVVDYTENADGTLTLTVDAVWPQYGSDCAFTNQIIVQPFADGTFRYLSNRIEEKEIALDSLCPQLP